MTIPASSLRVGTMVVDDKMGLCRVEDIAMVPPMAALYLSYEFVLRSLRTGAGKSVRRRCHEGIDVAELPERELDFIHCTVTATVLQDPLTAEQFESPPWAFIGSIRELRAGQRLVASFWQERPVSFRLATSVTEMQ